MFNGISTFIGYLMPKKGSIDTIEPITGRIREFNTFLKGISLKVNSMMNLNSL